MFTRSKSVHKFIVLASFLLAGGQNLFPADGPASGVLAGSATLHGTTSAFVVDPKNSSVVYAATSRGLFKSMDGGNNWLPTKLTTALNALVVDRANPSIMYAATSGKGVFKGIDSGSTWTESGLPNAEVKTVLVLSDSGVFAGVFYGGLQKSTHCGSKWIDAGISDKYVNELAADSSKPSVVYAATGGGPGRRAPMRGVTWTKTNLSGQVRSCGGHSAPKARYAVRRSSWRSYV